MRWFEKTRQEWIAETLAVFGFIQRKHLMRKFGISMVQASSDLQQFKANNPGAMRYDVSTKCYIAQKAPLRE